MLKFVKQRSRILTYLIMLILVSSTNTIYAQLVTNGGFENTAPGPVTGTDIEGWTLFVESGVTSAPDFEIVPDTVQEGSRALKAVINGLGANPWDIQLVADSIPVDPGTTYLYSVWAKTENPGAQVNFTIGNYNYDEYGALRAVTLSDEWEKYSFEFTISDQETYARAPIHFSLSGNTGSTIYIDNMLVISVEQDSISRYPVILEAESGAVGSDFAVLQDGNIDYIQIQTDGSDFTPPIWDYPGFERRTATYDVTFAAGFTYNLFARIRVGPQRYDDDSFFYADGFGVKDTINADDWIAVNQLQVSGFSDSNDVVLEPGGLEEGIWKWVNLSQNSYYEQATTFKVKGDSLTNTLQIGGRETGLDIDRLAFGRSDLYFTVGNLDNGEQGSEDYPGSIWEGPPLATGFSKFLGSAYSTNQAPNFESYWNQMTPENAGKWGSVEATRDVMNWAALDAAYNFAKNHGFPFRYHVLVWGNQQPQWIESLPPNEQLQEIEEWFAAVAARYPDIDYLEVVNEPLHDPPQGTGNGNYIEALGGSNGLYGTGWDWVIKAFELARQYFPASTKLMINDYNIIGYSNNTANYLELIDLLQQRNLIDGIGFQAHGGQVNSRPVSTIRDNLDSLATTGLFIQVTEMDVDGQTDQQQLTEYQRIFPVFWEHPSVVGITLWGWKPGLYNQTAYLLNNNGTERPALVWLREYLQNLLASVDSKPVQPLRSFKLYDNYPNPFNPATKISYYLPQKTMVTLDVFDIMGRQVKTLVRKEQASGQYTVTFDAGSLASGIYLYRIKTNSFTDVKRMLLMK